MSLTEQLCRRHPDLLKECVRTLRVTSPAESGLVVVSEQALQALADDGRGVDVHITLDSNQAASVISPGPEATESLLAALFWPVTWWTLRRRRARDWVLQLALEIDNLQHFSLPHGQFTALNINSEWVWTPGHHGIASLHFTFAAADMQEWLAHAVRATTSKNDLYWEWLTPWYTAFRNRTASYTTNATRQERLLAELAAYDHWDEPEEAWPGWEGW